MYPTLRAGEITSGAVDPGRRTVSVTALGNPLGSVTSDALIRTLARVIVEDPDGTSTPSNTKLEPVTTPCTVPALVIATASVAPVAARNLLVTPTVGEKKT